MSRTTGGHLLRAKQGRKDEAGGPRRHRGIVRRFAVWRRIPGSPVSGGTLALVAGFALACPIVAAVAVASVSQIIPDFDASDWDGPDDDSWGEKHLTTIGSPPDGHSGHHAASVMAIPLPCTDLERKPSRHIPGESHLEAPIGERQGDAPSFRGPPRITDASRRA